MPRARIASHRIHYHVSDGCAVVRPEGACDADTTEALARLAGSSLIESKNLILDLSRSRYVETPGYRWIVRQLKDLESAGKTLVVVGLPPSVERTFTLLKLDKTIPTAKTVSEALRKLRGNGSRQPALV
ncbi:MAG: STAS domain-containing protein [Armatimonadetes bacterium]|nr:STAS domain-containing protein [Armatimonadota bacterium]